MQRYSFSEEVAGFDIRKSVNCLADRSPHPHPTCFEHRVDPNAHVTLADLLSVGSIGEVEFLHLHRQSRHASSPSHDFIERIEWWSFLAGTTSNRLIGGGNFEYCVADETNHMLCLSVFLCVHRPPQIRRKIFSLEAGFSPRTHDRVERID